jgi:hypothetical protein
MNDQSPSLDEHERTIASEGLKRRDLLFSGTSLVAASVLFREELRSGSAGARAAYYRNGPRFPGPSEYPFHHD